MKTALWIAIALNAFALYIIVMQDDFIDQNMYDLNVSQTTVMIQKLIIENQCLDLADSKHAVQECVTARSK